MPRENKSAAITAAVFCALALLVFIAPRVPQDPAYHRFAADHRILGVPNFFNVLSNLAFIWVAILSWVELRRSRPHARAQAIAPDTLVFLSGVFLTGFGSAYYHWEPSTDRLFWDRLPMTLAFGGVSAALVRQRISASLGSKLLWPLVATGILSVLFWRWSERLGRGNLVPYGIVQFGTVLLIVFVLFYFPMPGRSQRCLWAALAAYAAAKILEAADAPIAGVLRVIGGHPIKHLAAAVGGWFLFKAISSADPLPNSKAASPRMARSKNQG